MKAPRVAIIVLNFNGYDLTKECLFALSSLAYPEKEVILVDNCSSHPDEPEKLHGLNQYFDHLVLIPERNRGFAGGMNFGMAYAEKMGRFEYYLCCSNDIIPKSDFLDNLVSAMQSDPKIGIAGPVQYYHNQKLEMDSIYCAGTFVSGYLARCGHVHEIRQPPRLDYVNGAVFAIRRSCYRQTEGFDPIYYNWYEDIDLSARAKRLGWTLSLVPDSIVWHKVGQTVNKPDFRFKIHSIFYHFRNKVLFVKKNWRGARKFIFMLYFFFAFLPFKTFTSLIQIAKHPEQTRPIFLVAKAQCTGAYEGLTCRKPLHSLETIPDEIRTNA